jgi:hypothetical protein
MENKSEVGQVNLSQDTYELLKMTLIFLLKKRKNRSKREGDDGNVFCKTVLNFQLRKLG